MSSKPPPVPPENRSPKGPASSGVQEAEHSEAQGRKIPENLAQQDQQGNTKQNTTHQGYTQDR